MDTITTINEKINLSRKTLSDLMNLYIQDKITVEEFWKEQVKLDAKVIVLEGEIKIIRRTYIVAERNLTLTY